MEWYAIIAYHEKMLKLGSCESRPLQRVDPFRFDKCTYYKRWSLNQNSFTLVLLIFYILVLATVTVTNHFGTEFSLPPQSKRTSHCGCWDFAAITTAIQTPTTSWSVLFFLAWVCNGSSLTKVKPSDFPHMIGSATFHVANTWNVFLAKFTKDANACYQIQVSLAR